MQVAELRPFNTDINYIEIIRCSINFEDHRALILSLTTFDTFTYILQKTKQTYKYVKPFSKTFKQFVFNNITYNITPKNGEVQVYSLNPISVMKKVDNCVAIGYHKKKLSILNFPSTTNYDDIRYITRTTFRISNRIFINFDELTSSSVECQEKTYHMYANYNHDTNVDWDTISTEISRVWSTIAS
jgi:hypothetical protein